MSTRSGKRIHSSIHDGTMHSDPDLATKSERKTRSKRLKDNNDAKEPKSKKRENYVAYPTDDEHVDDTGRTDASNAKRTRGNTLKEQNINIPSDETEYVDVKKPNRVTRQTRKFAENIYEDGPNGDQGITEVPDKKIKKNKKKKEKHAESLNENGTESVVVASKKSRKKKKKNSNSISKETKKDLNKSNISTDSFHSAAGSPLKHVNEVLENSVEKTLENQKVNTTFEKEENVETHLDTTFEKETRSKKKLSITDTTFVKNNITTTPGKSRRSSVKNCTFDKIGNTPTPSKTSIVQNCTLQKSSAIPGKAQNSTFDNIDAATTDKFNTTFEKEPISRRSLRYSNVTEVIDIALKHTLDKISKDIPLNSTYDKETKLDSTYDKNEATSSKSSLISSDSTLNLTFDKSDNSRISITSDDSKTENVLNTTPVLIESSMDESKHSEQLNSSNKTKTPNSIQETVLSVTPLKREGTFTKDGPEIIITSPKPKISLERTPTKRMSLLSPGFTPYHVSQSAQSSQKEKKSLMNVTRSIEKPTRQSSLAEVASRQTRVMFCSPVNNPEVMTQQKKKVIKSSMKGSNKSFVFEESDSVVRPATRKRSLTQGDAEESRAKRKRFAESGNRFSRPRTSSSCTKLPEPTPVKKPVTPLKTRSELKRTKLPNFAALHQKQFEKMESLDECQLRKAQRARQLLTPNGGGAAAARPPKRDITSIRGTCTEPKEPTKEKETKRQLKLGTTLPTLESLRPGFTRFGFRMNCNVNPFTATTTGKEKTNGVSTQIEKSNGLPTEKQKPTGLTRQMTQPTLNGTTLSRKTVAKQTIMREKSFTSLSNRRDATRNENRTIIKGVRTNRRFDLQMKMRNLE